jgi:predicted nucleic acid-binding protein
VTHSTRSVFVLDSFAVMALLDGEAGAPRVQGVLQSVRRRLSIQTRVCLSVINLGEVLYITERERGLSQAQQTLSAIEQLPIEILDATRKRVLAAAHIKANHRVSYADAFAIAAAEELDAVLLTGDPEFEAVKNLIQIEWLPR